jgi:Trk-type K+ transport system membrane component
MTVNTWSQVLTQSFQDLWIGVIGFVPNLVVAILIVIIGWAVGVLLGRVVAQIIKSLRLDEGLRKAGLEEFLNRGGINLNSGAFVGALVKWFVLLVFTIAALDVLRLNQVTLFLRNILEYIPQVVVAVLILLAAGIIGDALKRVVVSSARSAELKSSGFLGSVTKWAIWIFAILVALTQLGIAPMIINTLFTGFVVALSLAFGLAFGLGGQEAASRVVDKMGKELSHKD